MLDWLKTIMGDAYTEDIDKKVSEEIGKGFASKADFNAQGEKLKGFEAEIKARDEQLEELKKASGDTEALNKKIEELQEANKAQKSEYDGKIADMQFDTLLDAALSGAKAKNLKSVKANLDIDALKASKNQEADMKAAIEAVRKDNDYLFVSDEPIKNPVAGTEGGGAGGGSSSNDSFLRSLAGLPPAKGKEKEY